MRPSSVIALLTLLAMPAFAQKVVILEIDGDPQGKLRAQIEAAVRSAAVVELIPLKSFKDAAARKKLKGAAAMTPVGVTRAAKLIKLDAAVGGEVTEGTYKVLVYDRAGEQLWSKELPVKKGMLSEDFAGKLARAIAAAAEQGAARTTAAPPPDETGGEEVSGGIDLTGSDPGQTKQVDPDRDTDLEDPNRRKKQGHVPVPIFRVGVTGTTTWRSQCLRPGVTTCKEYELAQTPPTGISIDFTATVPYLGIHGFLDVFPLARFDNRILQGFGILLEFMYGQSQTRIVEETPQGQGPDKVVRSDDVGFSGQLAWRYHFQMGYGDPQPVGWAGIRGGLVSRSFMIDPTAGTSLPSSQRAYPTGIGFPTIGLDAAVPLNRFLRFEATLQYFINPRPADEQIIGYGNLNDPTGGASATGLGLELGVTGNIWGPIGYAVRWRYMGFTDRYYGQGQKWTVCNEQQCGGVGEESFHSIIWGVTASY